MSRRGFPAAPGGGRREQHEGRQARAGGSRAPTAPPRGRAPTATRALLMGVSVLLTNLDFLIMHCVNLH